MCRRHCELVPPKPYNGLPPSRLPGLWLSWASTLPCRRLLRAHHYQGRSSGRQYRHPFPLSSTWGRANGPWTHRPGLKMSYSMRTPFRVAAQSGDYSRPLAALTLRAFPPSILQGPVCGSDMQSMCEVRSLMKVGSSPSYPCRCYRRVGKIRLTIAADHPDHAEPVKEWIERACQAQVGPFG